MKKKVPYLFNFRHKLPLANHNLKRVEISPLFIGIDFFSYLIYNHLNINDNFENRGFDENGGGIAGLNLVQ